MAQTRTIVVESVEERTSQQGKRFWRVKVAGERQALFCWDAGLAQALTPGLTYQVTINGSQDYPRITDATLIPDAPAEPGTPPATSDRQRQMLKMSALRTTGEILHGSALPADQVIAYAEALLQWLES